MSDRIDALTVILDKPLRLEQITPLANAIRQMNGVLEVIPLIREAPATAIAEQRVHHELYAKVLKVLEPPMFGWPMERNNVAL